MPTLLYGVKIDSKEEGTAKYAAGLAAAEEVTDSLSKLLNLQFQGRESSFWGDYWLAEYNTTKIKVLSQPDYRVDEIMEEDFEDYQVLIYVDGASVSGINGLVTPHGVIEVLKES
jgi:hypothetical protein